LRDARVDGRRRGVVEVDRGLHRSTSIIGISRHDGGDGRTWRRRLRPLVLQYRDIGLILLRNELRQRDRAQKTEDVRVEVRPQLVRHAALAVILATLASAALGRVDRLVDRDNDVGDGNHLGTTRKTIAAAGTAHAFDEAMAAQLAEELFEIRQGDLLPLRHPGKRDRAFRAVHRDIDHRRDGESSFGGKAHGRSPLAG